MDIAGDLERFLSEDLYPYRYPLTIGLAVAVLVALAVAYRLGWHVIAWRRRLVAGPALVIFLVIFLVIAIPLGNYLLSPLWERTTVCEASPIPGAGAGSDSCDDTVLASTNSPAATVPRTASGTPTAAATAAATKSPIATGSFPAQTTDAPAPTSTAAPPAATDAPTPVATEATAPGFQPHVVRQGEFAGADNFHFGNGKALLIESEPGVYVLRFEEFSVRNGPDLFVYLSPDPGGYDDAAINLGELKGTDGAFNYEIPAGTDVSQFQSAVVWCRAFSVLFAHATFGPDL